MLNFWLYYSSAKPLSKKQVKVLQFILIFFLYLTILNFLDFFLLDIFWSFKLNYRYHDFMSSKLPKYVYGMESLLWIIVL